MKNFIFLIILVFANLAHAANTKIPTSMLAEGSSFTKNTDFTSSNQSLLSNGYQKLPGGLIIQWGSVTAPTGSGSPSLSTSFPIPFPTACLSITGVQTGAVSTSGDLAGNCNASSYGFVYRDTGNRTVKWIAIGH